MIERPPPRRQWFRAPAEWLSFLMSTRRIRLDAKGSFVWRRLDGRRVQDLAEEMRAEFGSEVEPAEERLGTLIRQLRTQEMVAYPGWDAQQGVPSGAADQK